MLAAATRDAERVWPVFVADPALLSSHARARNRVAWFDASLHALDRSLGASGSGLVLLDGPPERALAAFAREVGADRVYASADEDPVAVARDERVARAVDLRLVDDGRVVPPSEMRTGSGEAYTVFSPFRRALDARVAASHVRLTDRRPRPGPAADARPVPCGRSRPRLTPRPVYSAKAAAFHDVHPIRAVTAIRADRHPRRTAARVFRTDGGEW